MTQLRRKYGLFGESVVATLPIEILSAIFKFISTDFIYSRRSKHHAHIRGWDPQIWRRCDCAIEDKQWVYSWYPLDRELLEGLIFPDNLRAVCRRWRDLVESIPAFWSRLVIFVDDRPTSLLWVSSALTNSGDLPLHLFVLRRPRRSDKDAGEYAHCRAIIELLSPHFRRCSTISFEVLNSSSLPSISADFRGRAPFLERLHLKCQFDDGKAPGPHHSAAPSFHLNDPFTCPNLYDIDIDGRNFVYAWLDLTPWVASLRQPKNGYWWSFHNGLCISLSNFRPVLSKDTKFTIHDFVRFLASLPALVVLNLSRIQFASGEIKALPNWNRVSIEKITFTTLTSTFLDNFLYICTFDSRRLRSAHFDQCEIPRKPSPNAHDLILSNVDDYGQNLEPFLAGWRGSYIEFNSCPGLDDFSLCCLAGKPRTHFLMKIVNCRNCTTRGLMAMIALFNRHLRSTTSVHYLSLEGFAMLPPTRAEAAWIASNVQEFQYKQRISDEVASKLLDELFDMEP